MAIIAERNIEVAHTTIMRWVQRYVSALAKRWQRYTRPVGRSWRCDETYIRIKGKWGYLYCAVDREGQTVDFFLSEHLSIAAAKRFFAQTIEKRGRPEKITLDGYAASHVAVGDLQGRVSCPSNSCADEQLFE